MNQKPVIVCLCGSTRFYEAFQEANYDETMAGKIVLSVGFYPHSVEAHGHGEGVGHNSQEKVALDELHKRKIDLADEVLVLDVDGYIGTSTRSEIEYAEQHGKGIRYLSKETPEKAKQKPKQGMLFVDATPDSGYPVRVLSAYIDESTYTDILSGLESTNPLVILMNEAQAERNKLLRTAIAVLRDSRHSVSQQIPSTTLAPSIIEQLQGTSLWT